MASEGVDFQFTNTLINYDLPWNPMRLEQRIGRVDRIGQKSDTITVFNMCYENTIDERILDILDKKIKRFENVFGNTEKVIGEEIKKIISAYFTNKLTPEQEHKLVAQSKLAIINNEMEEEKLENEALSLVAHGGYVLDKINRINKTGVSIQPNDLLNLLTIYFKAVNNGNFIKAEAANVYKIRLSEITAHEFAQFMANHGLLNQSKLQHEMECKCKFINKTIYESGLEIINQFHPLIKFVIHKLKEQINQLVFRFSACAIDKNFIDLPAGNYGLYLQSWSINGIFNEQKVIVNIINLDSSSILDDIDSEAQMYKLRSNSIDLDGEEGDKIRQYDLFKEYRIIKEFTTTTYNDYRESRKFEHNEKINREIEMLKAEYMDKRSAKENQINDETERKLPSVKLRQRELGIIELTYNTTILKLETKLKNFIANYEEVGFIVFMVR